MSTNAITKTYSYFDLDTFESKEEEVSVAFSPATSYESAVARLGNDATVLLKALNNELRAQALSEAEKTVKARGGARSVVLAVIRPFREMEPWKSVSDRSDQTAKIIADIVKPNPAMIAAIRSKSLESND